MDREPEVNEDRERDAEERQRHPTPEQFLMRQAVKSLTPKQRKIWAMFNFDRMPQERIGLNLGISQQVVSKQIKAAESRITRYIRANMGSYLLMKKEHLNKED